MSELLISVFKTHAPRQVQTGEYLFHVGQPVRSVFKVAQGVVLLERPLPHGDVICQQRACAGDILAEASAYSQTYHCDARCVRSAQVQAVPKAEFLDRVSTDPLLAAEWSKHLAKTVQAARLVGEMRSLKTVSERLDVWLFEHGKLPEKGQWQLVANELAVSREALYRELSKRKCA